MKGSFLFFFIQKIPRLVLSMAYLAKARPVLEQKYIKTLMKEEAITGADLESVQSSYDVSLSDYRAGQNNLKISYAKITELQIA